MGSAFDAEHAWWPAALVPELVTCSLASPDLVCHRAHQECPVEAPHPLASCGRFVDRPLVQRHARSCGATVAAYVSGWPVAVAEGLNGRGCTTVAKLRATLRALGVATRPTQRVSRQHQPKPGDVVIVRWVRGSHYAVKVADGYFDPAGGEVVQAFAGGRVTSFVPVIGSVCGE